MDNSNNENSLNISFIEKKIAEFNETLLKYALHDYSAQNKIDYHNDLFDSLALSINFLGEELNYSTITKEYLGDIFNSMDDMLIVIDNNGIIKFTNNSTKNKLSYKDDELIEINVNNIISSQIDIDNFPKGQKINKNHYLKTSNNAIIPVLLNITPFVRGDGQKIGMVIIARDTTTLLEYQSKLETSNNELIIAKDKAEQSDKLKSAFLANMSHEIRTPLNALMGFSELLLNPGLSEEKRSKYANIIKTRGNDLLNIINDILDVSKIEAGLIDIIESRTDIEIIFNELIHIYELNEKVCSTGDIKISYLNNLAKGQNIIETDQIRLTQILNNLILNALKFTKKGEIKFGCKLYDNHNLLFYVKDTGIGIPSDKLDLIFMRFRQGSDSYLVREQGGSGLGLSICKGILELMKGKIWVESEMGKGSTFYFTIPYKPVINLPTNNQSFQESNYTYNWENKTILIIEDYQSNVEYLTELLSNTNINCLIAYDGIAALSIIKQNKNIDMILMDIGLPDIDGFELTKIIKETNPDMIIIVQTAFVSSNYKDKCIEIGCNDYLSKPIYKEILFKALKKYLG